MQARKRAALLLILAGIFGMLAVIFISKSEIPLNSSAAKMMGVESVMNLQSTLYAIGCGIISAINLVGAYIIIVIDEGHD